MTAARTLLPELIRRLVLATVDRTNLERINFPAGEEVQRHGYDGTTSTKIATTHVPQGLCVWELSCERECRGKAERDYRDRVGKARGKDLRQVTYVAVTARDWNGAANWAEEKTAEANFKEVRAYDSNSLEHWLLDAPAVGLWLVEQIGTHIKGVSDVATYWRNVLGTLKRELPPWILLTNRQGTAKKLAEWVVGNPGPLAVRATSAGEVVDVFVAWVHTLPTAEADAVASRAIIVENAETWKALATSKQSLILVAGPRLEATPELLAEAKRQGHHLLRFARFTEPRGPAVLEIEYMRIHDLKEALQRAGIEEREAAQLAEGAGGNFTVLRRLFAGDLAYVRPPWAEGAEAPHLASLLLAAAWNEANAEDKRVLAEVVGRPYAEIETLAVRWRQEADPPLRRVGRIWEFVSSQDAWILLHKALTSSRVDVFESVVVEVLGETNPALDLPAEERFMAPLQGKCHKYSDAMRGGLAEILALSAGLASENLVTDEHDFIRRGRRIVSRLLPAGCSWKRWASIGGLLPLLAEAAPEEFLNAIAQDLKSGNPELLELMRQEHGDVISGAVYHAGLLWGLEALAWTTKYTARVADLLARLAALDPGGKWNNRPGASLKNLFFSWRPQTMATLDELLAIVGRLAKKQPETTWKLVLDLLPEHQSSVTDSYKPSPWRSWAAGWTGEVVATDYWRYISGVASLALDLAAADASRWPELLERCTALPPAERSRIFAALEQINPATLSDVERLSLWEKLRQLVQKHAPFRDADWALPTQEVQRLESIRDRFAPQDEVKIAEPLFTDPEVAYENLELSHEEREALLRQRRQEAVKRVWNAGGLPAVLILARRARYSSLVGIALAERIGAEPEAEIIPALLSSSERQIEGFAGGYAVTRIHSEGRDWAERLPSTGWSAEQVAAFACCMLFDLRTWDWVENAGPEVKRFYWARVGVSRIPKEPTQLETAALKLIEACRPGTAVWLLGMGMSNGVSVSCALLLDVLEALLSAKGEAWQGLEKFYVQQFIKRLQADPLANKSRLAKLEFGFLPVLGPYTLRPYTLEELLARDATFFVDCLKVLYRPRRESTEEKQAEPNREEAERVKFTWRLLRDWQRIPGTQPDGSISASELREWVTAARMAAREADRLEVCDVKIGEVFAHAPSDDQGVKPCVPIREIIEECESDALTSGFATGLFNLQGVSSRGLYEGGEQERQLATTYERYAEACEVSWPRTAAALRNVAQSFTEMARRLDEDAQMRE